MTPQSQRHFCSPVRKLPGLLKLTNRETMQLRRTLGCFRGAEEPSPGRPKVDFSPPGSGEDPTRDKSTPKGQVRVPFLEEAASGKAMTLALDIGFPGAAFSQELHSTGLSPENALQRLFLLIVARSPKAANARGQKCLEEEKQRQEVAAA